MVFPENPLTVLFGKAFTVTVALEGDIEPIAVLELSTTLVIA